MSSPQRFYVIGKKCQLQTHIYIDINSNKNNIALES